MPLRGIYKCLVAAVGAAVFLTGALPAPAANVSIGATLGIGGRYRPDTWFPVTVTVSNKGSQVLRGQVEVLAKPLANQNQGRYLPRASALYAVPLTIPADHGAPHTVTVYVRGLDPVRDNLTVQFVDGQERGGGQVFADASVFSSAKTSAISGSQVNGSDLFLVGVTDDPNAYHFLRGSACGLLHTRSGPRTPETFPLQSNGTKRTPGALQVSSPAPGSLPDRPAGYSGVDAVLLRADTSLDQLTEPQTEALKDWVVSGGRLIITHGPADSVLQSSGLKDLLPAGFDGVARTVNMPSAGSITVAGLNPKRTSTVLITVGGVPIAVAGSYGAGRVTMAAVDLTSEPFQSAAQNSQVYLWRTIIGSGIDAPESLLAYTAQYEEGAVATYGGASHLTNAVLRIAAFDTPSTGFVALFLLVYVIVLVPLNYLMLKRMDRKEWAWISIPGLVLLFAGGTYAAGFLTRGSSQFINKVTVLETSAGQHIAGAYDAVGMFSSHHANYDLQISDPNALASIPSQSRYGYYGGSMDEVNTYSAARFLQTGSGTKILDASIDMWAMRTFDSQTVRDLGGAIDVTLKKKPAHGGYVGTVTNNTKFALTHCVILMTNQRHDLGTLAPGASSSIYLDPLPVIKAPKPAPGNGYPGYGGNTIIYGVGFTQLGTGGDQVNAPLEDRMLQGALRAYGEMATNDPNQYGMAGLNDEPIAPIGSSRDQATLLASSADPALSGPDIKVDGGSIAQHRATLIAVHIPLPK